MAIQAPFEATPFLSKERALLRNPGERIKKGIILDPDFSDLLRSYGTGHRDAKKGIGMLKAERAMLRNPSPLQNESTLL